MIIFGICVGYPEKYETIARPGIGSSCPPGYVIDAVPSVGNVFAAYAGIMERARAHRPDALVLMHDDLELQDPETEPTLRDALADPDVAIVGLIGSRGAPGLRWWEGERAGRVTDLRFGLHDFGFDKPDVDTLDGMFLALSPWAIENLTLDGLGYEGLHGYADELCAQARAKGKKVRVVDITAKHHSQGGYVGGKDAFDRAEKHYLMRRDPWAMVRGPAETWDIDAMYTAKRGAPVSTTPHIMLATPAYNPPCLEFLNARDMVSQDLLAHGIDNTILTSPGDSLVMRGRHTLMHEFLSSRATHLLFWDVDIQPIDPSIVRQMLATGHEIVGGACPFRGETGQVVCNIMQADKDRKRVDTDDFGCVKVNEVGTGFLLMARTAIVKLCEAHPELLYFADLPGAYGLPMWALFDTVIQNQRFLSEDYFFCKLWRDLGGTVNVYVPFEAIHWGRKGFRGSFMGALGMRRAAT